MLSLSTYQPSEREDTTQRWVLFFVLLSILAHLLALVVIILLNHFLPPQKLVLPPAKPAEVSLSLVTSPATPPQSIVVPTLADPEAKADPTQQFESDHDSRMRSQSKQARDPNSVMPDIESKRKHGAFNDEAAQPKVKPSPPVPTPTPAKPTPTKPQPPAPTLTPAPPPRPQPVTKPPPPKPAPQNQVDPLTGLPVLPLINAPTMAPSAAPSIQPLANPALASSRSQVQASSRGAISAAGINSPASRATEFGRYLIGVHDAVASRWKPKTDASMQLLSVGVVHIEFTIHSDGLVQTRILQGGNDPQLQILLAISVNSITEAAPYPPFTESLKKEIIKAQGGDGESFTYDFYFSIYGG